MRIIFATKNGKREIDIEDLLDLDDIKFITTKTDIGLNRVYLPVNDYLIEEGLS